MNEYKDEMTDKVEKIGHDSLIHHGKSSDRIYLMKLAEEDILLIIPLLQELALRCGYGKIVAKIRSKVVPPFWAAGFEVEGYIPCFYKGGEDAFFVSLFLKGQRGERVSTSAMKLFSDLMISQQRICDLLKSEREFVVRQLGKEKILQMVEIYKTVFKSYPFPIQDPVYLSQTMSENVRYFGAFKNEDLVGLAAAEMDMENQNAEMTDFATLPAYAGNHLSGLLLRYMEQAMTREGIKTLYTIARLSSIAMNKTFLSSGYAYSGTLLNNTQIAGSIESMNLYYKLLR